MKENSYELRMEISPSRLNKNVIYSAFKYYEMKYGKYILTQYHLYTLSTLIIIGICIIYE